jgi:hypothetical protein
METAAERHDDIHLWTWGASTIRIKFQIAPPNVLKLVELSCLSHVDFYNGFGTVFQGVLWVFALRRDY